MKFLTGLAAAAVLVSSAAAAGDAAPVFILRKPSAAASTTPAPALPRQLARHILLQRLQADSAASFVDSLPPDYDVDAALRLVAEHGVPAAPLFHGRAIDESQPAQIVLAIEGVKPQQVRQLQDALPAALRVPSFTISDPPSAKANQRFFVDELGLDDDAARRDPSATVRSSALLSRDSKPLGGVFVAKTSREFLAALESSLDEIIAQVEAGLVEATLVLLPESSRASKLGYWTTTAPTTDAKMAPSELRKLRLRDASTESVMLEDGALATAEKSSSADDLPATHGWVANAGAAIPSCFQSFNACVAQTANCSSHGACVDKYAMNSGGLQSKAGSGVCFMCHCYSTLNEGKHAGVSTTQWAGNMCHKKDVSVPFWLLTGFSVTIVGAVAFAIGLLFSVGEEKLPGVIGAGVSRSK